MYQDGGEEVTQLGWHAPQSSLCQVCAVLMGGVVATAAAVACSLGQARGDAAGVGGLCLAAGLIGEARTVLAVAAAAAQLVMLLTVAGKSLLPAQNVAIGQAPAWRGCSIRALSTIMQSQG